MLISIQQICDFFLFIFFYFFSFLVSLIFLWTGFCIFWCIALLHKTKLSCIISSFIVTLFNGLPRIISVVRLKYMMGSVINFLSYTVILLSFLTHVMFLSVFFQPTRQLTMSSEQEPPSAIFDRVFNTISRARLELSNNNNDDLLSWGVGVCYVSISIINSDYDIS